MFRGFAIVSLVNLVVLANPALADEPEVPRGFTPLFNGRTLEGWTAHGGNIRSWAIDKGMLYVAQPARVRPGSREEPYWLMTEKEYGDFELRLEFRVPPGGNSGVALRAPPEGDPSKEGLEIQILDDGAQVYKKLRPDRYTGSIYGVVAPRRRASKPAGEWNDLRIVCNGPRVNIELNGIDIVAANLQSLEAQHASKHPGLRNRRGHIGLQSHDGNVQFRNLCIKEL